MAQTLNSSSLLDTFGGLPVHPLAVHGAVVLLPLSALALAILIFVPKWRKSFFPLTLIGLGLSTVFTYIAKESGEALGERVGEPQTHEALGTILFPASVGLLALGITFYFLQRKERPKWQLQAAAGLALAGIISVSGLTYFVGHSGAEATWASRIAPYEAGPIETDPNTTSGAVAEGIALAEIAKHATREDCWTAIDTTVYDLTPYMQQHPGGAGSLAWLCGIDGTTAFKSQHASEQRPASELAGLAIGVYAGDVAPSNPSAAPTTKPSATAASPSAQPGTYTVAEVAKHNTGTDCWSVVNKNVYDLTPYVSSHPGGASVIKAICGKDGTAAFSGQHGGAATPTSVLAGFKLGALSTAAASGTLPQASVPSGEGEDDEEGDED
jgi:cytochrome b involved in lipid metabolism